MARKLTLAAIIIICFLLQSTIFQVLSFASIVPNLMVVVTASFGFMRGRKEGLFVGLFCGLLIDLFYGSYLGVYALIYVYIGYVNGMFKKFFYPDDIKLPLLLISASDLTCNLIVYLLLFLFRGQLHFSFYFLHIMLPELIYTILVTLILYFLILRINQKLESVERRRSAKFV